MYSFPHHFCTILAKKFIKIKCYSTFKDCRNEIFVYSIIGKNAIKMAFSFIAVQLCPLTVKT